MQIPIQYPDRLVREDGSEVECRFVPYRGGGLKKVVDGVDVDVKFTIALPVDSPLLLIGELITGYDPSGEVIVWQDSIAAFHRGHFHCKAEV